MLFKRRDFLKISLGLGGYTFLKSCHLACAESAIADKEALYYKVLSDKKVHCLRCPQNCLISEGDRGFCRIRENRQGKLYNIVYGRPCAVHIDPIEKKPFFHVLPGSNSFSLATVGCNLRCKFCQNWQISQARPEEVKNTELLPEQVVSQAQKNNCLSIAYTYTEPTVCYEYTLDTAKIAKEKGVKNVMHTNGFINPQPLRNLGSYFTAINVDLKGFNQTFYKNICAGNLNNVLESLLIIKNELRIWLELTNLLIPTLNDNTKDIKAMCVWIKNNLGANTPLHFSRFFPMYKLTTLPPTPVSLLEQARNIASDSGLSFVYIGNLPGHSAENTYCPNCQQEVITRSGYTILATSLINGHCKNCGQEIDGIWI